MIEKIKNISNEKMINLEYLKNSKLPLLLYGSGVYASIVKTFLESKNIKIDYVVLDKNFYKPDLYFYNFPVRLIDDVINEQSKVDVVFAFYKYRDEMVRLSSCEKVSKMFFFDGLMFPGFDKDFIETHYSILEEFYFRLEDELSKEILVAFIEAKKTGCPDALYQLNVKNEKQYFPSFIHLSENEFFVDCGAFDGDTSLIFDELTKGKGKIYAFECDKVNIEKLKKNTSHLKNIEIIEKGCWSEKTTLFFSNDGSSRSKIGDNGQFQIEVDSIDNVVQGEISFIKMDIEGAELAALEGAKNTILKYKPKLAISVYHKQEDFITIPQYILSLNKHYKLYLRNYGGVTDETILYAI